MNIPAVPKPTTIEFFDRVVTQLQDILKSELSWLNHSFGQSQKLATKKGRKDYFYPGVYIGGDTYLNVLPDFSYGNFSFFILKDPYSVEYNARMHNFISIEYGLIFWFDLSGIFPSSNDRNIEVIKKQILRILTSKVFLNQGSIKVNKIYKDFENIYKEYSLKEVNSQLLMHPYGGLRFEGIMTLRETC